MILIAPTSYKGTLTAAEAADAMAAGAAAGMGSAEKEIRTVPLSDGGNGLLVALEAAAGGKGQGARVSGPLGTSVTARFLVQDERAVVESAEACGLHLVPSPLRDPGRSSTRGVGELIRAARNAADPDAATVVGLGGSATVDAGAGMVSALGWKLLDESGDPIAPGGRGLLELHAIEPPDDPVELGDLVVLADVRNPLLGAEGAARVFGPQKGASDEDVVVLERGLEQWAEVVERELDRKPAALPGAGAAGGLGAAFAAFLDAQPRLGADWILKTVGFEAALSKSAILITGEGAWDEQSTMGKVTGEVIRRALDSGVEVLLVAGSVEGAVPDGVHVADGGGEPLDEKRIRAAVEDAMPALLARRRRR